MAETEKKTYKVGDTIQVKPGEAVTRPDGSSHIVIRGTFYLDQPGSFYVGDTEYAVK